MFDGLCSPFESVDSTSTNQSEVKVSKQLSETTTLLNPFGPAVGKVEFTYACSYRNQKGSIYIATKAVCFRCTGLFGWEIDRVIMPWDIIIKIDHNEHGVISIKTSNETIHILEGFDAQVLEVNNAMFGVWREYQKMDTIAEKNKGAIGELYGSLLSESLDSTGTDADSESETVMNDEDSNISEEVDTDEGDLSHSVEKMWSKLQNTKDERFTENAATDVRFNISLDEFFNQFLSDDAPVSLAIHHEASGDLDVKSTKWENEISSTQKRSITYNHPISIMITIAPPAGAATKTQRLQRFGKEGICLDTETWINDVPLADCFYVADRLLISSTADGGISLTSKFGICFVKRTMFKGIISATSVNDVMVFHKGYIDLIHRTVSESPLPNPNLKPARNDYALVQHNTSISKLDPKVKLKKRLDVKLFLILAIFVLACWDHIIFTKKIDEVAAKFEKLEELLIVQMN